MQNSIRDITETMSGKRPSVVLVGKKPGRDKKRKGAAVSIPVKWANDTAPGPNSEAGNCLLCIHICCSSHFTFDKSSEKDRLSTGKTVFAH